MGHFYLAIVDPVQSRYTNGYNPQVRRFDHLPDNTDDSRCPRLKSTPPS